VIDNGCNPYEGEVKYTGSYTENTQHSIEENVSMSEQRPQLNSIAYGVIILTTITAFIHIYLSFQLYSSQFAGPDPIFLLNGIGYLLLLSAIYAPIAAFARYQSLFCWILLAYTAVTIVLWYYSGARSWIAYIDKVIEVTLLLFLWLEARRFSE
jgi:hypothetical protein